MKLVNQCWGYISKVCWNAQILEICQTMCSYQCLGLYMLPGFRGFSGMATMFRWLFDFISLISNEIWFGLFLLILNMIPKIIKWISCTNWRLWSFWILKKPDHLWSGIWFHWPARKGRPTAPTTCMGVDRWGTSRTRPPTFQPQGDNMTPRPTFLFKKQKQNYGHIARLVTPISYNRPYV